MDVYEFVQTRVLPEYREIVTMLRGLMKEMDPEIKEVISYGILAFKKIHIIAVMNPTKKDITFAFSQGAKLKDKYGLLKGVGRVSKHLKLKKPDSIDREVLKYYIRLAIDLDSK